MLRPVKLRSTPSPLPSGNTGTQTPRIAVLTLDLSGRVTSANEKARDLWQSGRGELVGECFPDLFMLDIVSDEPAMVEARWEILLSETLDRTTLLSVQPMEGAPVTLAVRTERALGPAGGYIVTVEPPAPLHPPLREARWWGMPSWRRRSRTVGPQAMRRRM